MSREANAPRDKNGRYLTNKLSGQIKGFFSRLFKRG